LYVVCGGGGGGKQNKITLGGHYIQISKPMGLVKELANNHGYLGGSFNEFLIKIWE
jgi:hypothetical protein